MSDFDKEAERERLREKYEEDKQKREASERMSDLLLKGATMTNSHCGSCGDPIFRYDGEEFCPTCQRVVTNDDAVEAAAENDESVDDALDAGDAGADTADDAPAADAGTGAASDENGDAPGHIEIKQPDGPAVQTGASQPDDAGTDTDEGTGETDVPAEGTSAPPEESAAAGAQPSESGRRSQSEPSQPKPSQSEPSQPKPSQSDPLQPEPSQPKPSQSEPSQRSSPTSPGAGGQSSNRGGASTGDVDGAPAADVDGEFRAARASLVRTLRSHAERAEACDDPRRARDHLAAAREAAEALSALSSSY
ncbi:MAG: Sjogren's syndrome/scleroderma autoantigen 1 family protein [Halosimplex sp.]